MFPDFLIYVFGLIMQRVKSVATCIGSSMSRLSVRNDYEKFFYKT